MSSTDRPGYFCTLDLMLDIEISRMLFHRTLSTFPVAGMRFTEL